MKTPVICIAQESVAAFETFNPNTWAGQCRVIVRSCATTAGVANHNVHKIAQLCASATELCGPHFERIAGSPALDRVRVFVQVPELHSAIVSFLVSVKTTLDFLAQLVCASGVVNAGLDGFHNRGDRLLNALQRNTPQGKKESASVLVDLIQNHKESWIDGVIEARDALTHPEKGIEQLMFEMQVNTTSATPVLRGVLVPKAGNQPIDKYAEHVDTCLHDFSRSILDCLAKSEP